MKTVQKLWTLCALVSVLCLTGCVDTGPENLTGLPKDYDGNVYDTVRIGNQVWMKQNLRVTHLNDGTPLINPELDADWMKGYYDKKPAYCWYDNDSTYRKPFGALYNVYAVGSGKLAPKGWRISNSDDWAELFNYMKDNKLTYYTTSPTNLGNWDAKPLADSLYWVYYGMEGYVGNQPWKNNSTGFSAVPAGSRGNDMFGFMGIYTNFWTLISPNIVPTSFEQKMDRCRHIDHMGVNMTFSDWSIGTGYSVRCIRDDK